MRCSFIALTIALFGQAVVASPAVASDPSVDASSLAASFPVSELRFSDAKPHANLTLSQDDFHIIAKRQEFPATLLICAVANCASNCQALNLALFTEGLCFPTSVDFTSVGISQPSNQGLPFVVGVGVNPCQTLLELPAVNECFNINGAVLNAFEVLP
ncbi:hypothetical protein OH77DRAFT_1410337 [Trametes cingulata]|nr:hypothetical protein OH77DRAFT_1410337 [Trametes cingulata]